MKACLISGLFYFFKEILEHEYPDIKTINENILIIGKKLKT
jgi:hypothetical protein